MERERSKTTSQTPRQTGGKSKGNLPWYIEESPYKEQKLESRKDKVILTFSALHDEKNNVYRNAFFKDKLVENLVKEVTTIPESNKKFFIPSF